ncbi:MAG TPA: SprT family zinc-dependent metalloprotease [Methanotrichaceae archaeon]|nr:SprT family zinc-dependent metalloprotease [Methanotrichaceae archaeon]
MSHHITISGIDIEIVRKNIKNLHIGVYPPEGRVRVAAPLRIDDDAVRLAVISRLSWIKMQRARFREQPRQSAREYITGESHYFLGRRYLLNVIEHNGPARVEKHRTRRLDLFVPYGADAAKRERVMIAWYRTELKSRVPDLIEKWQPVVGVQVADWGIKRMKTKWGSCNISARRIWLNLELAKNPIHCIEYVIVHETVHLLERHHNERFTALMDAFMPQWRHYRDELNRGPLSHEKWVY